MGQLSVGLANHDGFAVFRAKSGDRYFVRLRVGDKIIDVFFADPLHLDPLTPVDATPGEPNPPNWEQEYTQ